jgi:hypothetical protein
MLSHQADAALTRDGARFYYFIDPSLLELYFDPKLWAHRVSALPSAYEMQPLWNSQSQRSHMRSAPAESNTTLVTTALLTGEHIFSRGLIGSDQDLYVAPDHMAEFYGYLARTERAYRRALRSAEAEDARRSQRGTTIGLFDQLRHYLQGQRAVLEEGVISNDRWVEQVRNVVDRTLSQVASHDNLAASYRMRRLVDRDILANAVTLGAFHRKIIAPAANRVDMWSRLIAEAKYNNSVPPASGALEADAVTLEQLWALNSEADPERYYVMITADRGLHAACRRYRMTEGGGDRKVMYPLRYPTQYSPIFALNDEGGGFRGEELLRRIEESINLIASFSGPEVDTYDNIEDDYYSRADVGEIGAAPRAELARLRDELSQSWQTLLSFACSAKADLHNEILGGESNFWLDFVSSSEFRSAFVGATKSFREEAVRISETSTLLRYEIWVLQASADRAGADATIPEGFCRRALPSIFSAFESRSLMGVGLPDHAAQILSSGVYSFDDIEAVEVKSERLLLVSYISLEIGAWAGALALLREPEAQRPIGTALGYELTFFRAVSRRLAATAQNWQLQYDAARNELRQLFDVKGKDKFQTARLNSESIALDLCLVVWEYDISTRSGGLSAIARAIRALGSRDVSGFISERALGNFGVEEMKISRQLSLNMCCAIFWEYVVRGQIGPDADRKVDGAIEFLDSLPSSILRPGPHTAVYPLLARAVTDGGPNMSSVSAALSAVDSALDHEFVAEFGFSLPDIDRIELTKARDILMGWAIGV